MDSINEVQILNETVSLSLYANNLVKAIDVLIKREQKWIIKLSKTASVPVTLVEKNAQNAY